jgi:N-acetylneuraminic acid mutarotase
LKKPLIVGRSKISLTVAKVQDHIATKNYVFAVGGQESSKLTSKVVERFHVRANIWQQLPTLNESRCEASSAILGDSLYVFGGLTLTANGDF